MCNPTLVNDSELKERVQQGLHRWPSGRLGEDPVKLCRRNKKLVFIYEARVELEKDEVGFLTGTEVPRGQGKTPLTNVVCAEFDSLFFFSLPKSLGEKRIKGVTK